MRFKVAYGQIIQQGCYFFSFMPSKASESLEKRGSVKFCDAVSPQVLNLTENIQDNKNIFNEVILPHMYLLSWKHSELLRTINLFICGLCVH